MHTWFSKQLGDGVLAYEPKDQIQAMFPPLFAAAARPVDMAVFTRHELEGRLECEVVAYFSRLRPKSLPGRWTRKRVKNLPAPSLTC